MVRHRRKSIRLEMAVNVERKWALLVSALAGSGFCVLALLVAAAKTAPFDNSVRTFVHAGAAPYLTHTAVFFSTLGRQLVLIPASVAIAAYLLIKGRRSESFAYMATMGSALVLNWALKAAFHRPRPQPFFGLDPDSFSFPSGHVLVAFCFCAAMTLILCRGNKLVLAACTTFVISVAWSRVYLGVHYPTDVVAGFLAGACWICALLGLGTFTAMNTIAER
jgi:undecaprenyl-diphosphatase